MLAQDLAGQVVGHPAVTLRGYDAAAAAAPGQRSHRQAETFARLARGRLVLHQRRDASRPRAAAALGWPAVEGFGQQVGLLETIGAKSGERRSTPLLYLRDGNHVVLIASKGGSVKHPAWYWNLKANPQVRFLGPGGLTGDYVAREAEGDERSRLWAEAVDYYDGFASYQGRTDGRRIPVVVLGTRRLTAGHEQRHQRSRREHRHADPHRRDQPVDVGLRRREAARAGEHRGQHGHAEHPADLADRVGRARGLTGLVGPHRAEHRVGGRSEHHRHAGAGHDEAGDEHAVGRVGLGHERDPGEAAACSARPVAISGRLPIRSDRMPATGATKIGIAVHGSVRRPASSGE